MTLTMIWISWDEHEFDKRETATTPETLYSPQIENHAFSARLGQTSLTAIKLTEEQAKSCQGISEADGFQVRWKCKVSPYCYGFNIEISSLEWFNKAQRESIRLFKQAAKADSFKVYTRV
ncbi:hypothetical protein N7495_003496 [Penicillium taxi]|uniref:uncharacterized protein n=1 Tax=Penicillium taxi TaxID=168475 RepID=UPI0025452017|nr:uncharacterized protein N7495_003496 [Penicillium taxi]KAJ5898752.1 hypothetical protein N7495_003496 [Penicillium taxi]